MPPLPGCDHCPTVCDYIFDYAHSPDQPRFQIRKWHKGKYDRISRELDAVDWDTEFLHSGIHQMYDRFTDVLTALVDDFVLVCEPSVNPSPPWKTNPPRSLRARRKHAWALGSV